jgi:ABC-2 type transport system permease protein/lipopolysaccharide transport system permease protein
MLNGLGFAFLFGTLSARFRDIPPLMTNVMQTLFFITPVIWHTNSLRGALTIADWNPFYHLIQIVRAPLLGEVIEPRTWLLAMAFTILNVGVALVIYARFRWRIPYWI